LSRLYFDLWIFGPTKEKCVYLCPNTRYNKSLKINQCITTNIAVIWKQMQKLYFHAVTFTFDVLTRQSSQHFKSSYLKIGLHYRSKKNC